MKKLSNNQQKVIDLMQQGWHLGFSEGFGTHVWLQKDGLGQGGDTEQVKLNTFNSLLNKNLIKAKKPHFPTTEYVLTEENNG